MYKVLFIFLLSCLFNTHATAQQQTRGLSLGDEIKNFRLKDQDGNTFSSADYLGKKNLVIFFYPKDESLVCSTEVCAFRDRYDEFQKAGAIVIGINGGSVESHKKFQQKEKLPYRLLSDPNNTVLKSFDVPNMFFTTGRQTYVIDKGGKVRFVYSSAIQASRHSKQALRFLNPPKTDKK